MNINAIILGEIIIISVIAIGFFSYFLAQRKTTSPIITTALGCVLAIIPPLGMIYLIILIRKNDLKLAQAAAN